MEFNNLIASRYSVRAYKPDDVEEEKLQQILQAAQLAPTAANRQPFQIIVIRTRGREKELQHIYHRSWFIEAPLILCLCAEPERGWKRKDGKNYSEIDTAIAMDHLILAAADLGLGTCWIAAFDPDDARQILHLPKSVEPIAFTPLGYPADTAQPKKRLPLDQLVRYEKW
ncbi:nitroreductase family protein [candidate division KSB1 bacterium]|nr:nitroreductase family protein [candidate division KSB1 bacterium]